MSKIKTVVKFFYYLLPKVIRDQYGDSIHFYSILFKNSLKNWNENISVSTIKLVDDINKLNCPIEILHEEKGRVSKINQPKLYLNEKYIFRSELEGEVPDIYVCLLSNIDLVGLSDALIVENMMFNKELSDMSDIHDLKCRDVFTKIPNRNNEYKLMYKLEDDKIDGVCISLLKEHSPNYYHWITEGLPRLVIALSILKNNSDISIEDCTVLIDYGMPSQCIEAMKILIPEDIKIRHIKKGHRIKCAKLIYVAPLWISLDNTQYLPNPKDEFFMDKYALEITKESITKHLANENKTILKNKKIYLQRVNTKLRPITNILEVEELLYKYNFDFVNTGGMSFAEQLNLFSQADIVIGPSGASFANMLFMKKGSTAISFYPSVQSTNYYLFQPIADVAGVDFVHFLTNPIDDLISLHAPSSIDIDNLNKLLEEIN